VGSHEVVLPWSRVQQAAFLIYMWQKIRDAVNMSSDEWAVALRRQRNAATTLKTVDPAFEGPHTLLNTDQGVRGVLYVTNDLCFVRATNLRLDAWSIQDVVSDSDERTIDSALQSLAQRPAASFLEEIASGLATYDWRTASAEGLSQDERVTKLVLRGSGGYREIRRQLLNHVARSPGDVGEAAREVIERLRYQ
jgi:hypothetical protein